MVAAGSVTADAAFPPDGWWEDFPAMGRYEAAGDWPKELRRAEVDKIAAHDGGIHYFVEQSETTPINGSLDDDRQLADAAAQTATDFDVPPGVPFWFAVDTDGRRYMDQVRIAFAAYRERVPDQWPIGAYAGSDVIDQLVADGVVEYGHIPAALSWSSTSRAVDNVTVFRTGGVTWYRTPNAHMRQHPSTSYRGGSIDRNDHLQATPVWFPGRTHLDPEEDDVTPEQDQRLANIELFVGEIFKALSTPPPGTDPALPSMQWCTFSLMDAYLKGRLSGDGGVAAHEHRVTGTAT